MKVTITKADNDRAISKIEDKLSNLMSRVGSHIQKNGYSPALKEKAKKYIKKGKDDNG